MASNTPNLDLLKKDPAIDGNDTFNIQTMLNDNWDKIDEAVGQVREEIQDIDVPAATIEKAGIVQLSSATNSSVENLAATPKAVKAAYDLANTANTTANSSLTAGNERKAELVAALVAKGITATTSETWAQLLAKVTALVKATGNATAGQVLSGATASNAGGPITGTMANRGSQSATLISQGQQYSIPAGYHDGTGKVTASFGNLVAGNVKSGVDIGGVVGSLTPGGYAKLSYVYNAPSPKGETFIEIFTFPPGTKYALFVNAEVLESSFLTVRSINISEGNIGLYLSHTISYGNPPFSTGFAYHSNNSRGITYVNSIFIDFVNGSAKRKYREITGGSAEEQIDSLYLAQPYDPAVSQKLFLYMNNPSGVNEPFYASINCNLFYT